jgi:IS30 family transposase
MTKYKQLTHKERYQIYALIKEGFNYSQIAKNIGVNKSTISREIKRNSKSKNTYHPDSASIEAFVRHKNKTKFIKIDKTVEKWIRKFLKLDWTPEQISGRLKEKRIANITHEAIYQYIYKNKANGGRLYLHLVRKMKKYQKRDGQYNSRGLIVNRVSISKRPKIVDNKIRIGDWEVDTIIGKYHQGAIVTIVDRKSKFTLMRILPTKEAIGVSNAIIELLYPVRQFTHTITSDNGKEFTLHENISKSLNTDFYFCDPYSSWQRGLNENTNGLIRRYIPKRTEFENISKNEIMMIQNCLNHRPRKALGYKTPFEVFMNEISRKMVA